MAHETVAVTFLSHANTILETILGKPRAIRGFENNEDRGNVICTSVRPLQSCCSDRFQRRPICQQKSSATYTEGLDAPGKEYAMRCERAYMCVYKPLIHACWTRQDVCGCSKRLISPMSGRHRRMGPRLPYNVPRAVNVYPRVPCSLQSLSPSTAAMSIAGSQGTASRGMRLEDRGTETCIT